MKELVYHRFFLQGTQWFADEIGIVDGEYRATLGEHRERVFRLTNALGPELGIDRADRFAVMALNSHQYLELYHAAFLGGGVINPLNLRLAGKELAYILEDSGTEVIFVDGFFAPLVAEAIGHMDNPRIRHTVLIGAGDVEGAIAYEDVIAAGSTELPPEPEEDDPVVLMYTGGTTGLPKGVLLEQRAEMLNLVHVSVAVGLSHEETNLIQTPMFHAASVSALLGIPAAGGRLVTLPVFDPGAVLDLIESEGVTQTTMVPTMIGMCMQHPDYAPGRLASLSTLFYGASPMPPAILEHLLEKVPSVELTQAYGMTESSAVLTVLPPEDHVLGGSKLTSVGRPALGVMLSIQDEEGTILPPGEIGEVCARAGNFMREYWNKPEATEEVFAGGWYHSGDAGYLDDKGYLFLVDRVKDMIVTGGENVYSAEVEGAIGTHDAVAQVAVIGIPHDIWGEQVHAIVVLNEGVTVTEEELVAHARESIAGYKLPKSVEFRAEPLPLSGAMKVLKRELRAPYWEGRDRKV